MKLNDTGNPVSKSSTLGVAQQEKVLTFIGRHIKNANISSNCHNEKLKNEFQSFISKESGKNFKIIHSKR
jgi:hypothetical protein